MAMANDYFGSILGLVSWDLMVVIAEGSQPYHQLVVCCRGKEAGIGRLWGKLT